MPASDIVKWVNRLVTLVIAVLLAANFGATTMTGAWQIAPYAGAVGSALFLIVSFMNLRFEFTILGMLVLVNGASYLVMAVKSGSNELCPTRFSTGIDCAAQWAKYLTYAVFVVAICLQLTPIVLEIRARHFSSSSNGNGGGGDNMSLGKRGSSSSRRAGGNQYGRAAVRDEEAAVWEGDSASSGESSDDEADMKKRRPRRSSSRASRQQQGNFSDDSIDRLSRG